MKKVYQPYRLSEDNPSRSRRRVTDTRFGGCTRRGDSWELPGEGVVSSGKEGFPSRLLRVGTGEGRPKGVLEEEGEEKRDPGVPVGCSEARGPDREGPHGD